MSSGCTLNKKDTSIGGLVCTLNKKDTSIRGLVCTLNRKDTRYRRASGGMKFFYSPSRPLLPLSPSPPPPPPSPSPLSPREGRSGKEWPYGAEHLISEVSSDVRYLRVQPSFTNTSHRSLTVALVGHNEVGVRILTSGGCGTTPDDVTAKYRREVAEEMPPRSAGSKLSSHFPPPSRDCSFEVVTSDEASLGEQQ